jgi:hypothetical protein
VAPQDRASDTLHKHQRDNSRILLKALKLRKSYHVPLPATQQRGRRSSAATALLLATGYLPQDVTTADIRHLNLGLQSLEVRMLLALAKKID